VSRLLKVSRNQTRRLEKPPQAEGLPHYPSSLG